MQGIILGSGTGIPSLERNAAGYFLEAGGMELLIDCGSGTLLQMERVKKNFRTLDVVLITHTHADHIADLTPLIHALRLPGLKREKPLHIYGPPGFKQFFETIVAPVARPPDRFPTLVIEAESEWTLSTLNFRSCPTVHTERMASVAYRIQEGEKSLVFSGDCDYDLNLIDFARDADLMILDCSTLDENKVQGHLSSGLGGMIAAKAGVKKLIPTHFYPISGPDSLRKQECEVQFRGQVVLAEDRMPFQVR